MLGKVLEYRELIIKNRYESNPGDQELNGEEWCVCMCECVLFVCSGFHFADESCSIVLVVW